MDLFDRTGKMALGSRLRLLTAKITEDAAKIYELYDVELLPKWFPVFFVLSENEEKTITEIAGEIGHSQPSVTKIAKEMTKAGLIESNLNADDKRKNVVRLTQKAKITAEKLKIQYTDVEAAIEAIQNEAVHDLWEAVAEWERVLQEKPLLRRVHEQKKKRESKDIQIVAYKSEYSTAFKALNEAWISKYFEMEEADYKALDNPDEYILKNGGEILVALYKNEPVGVCALLKMDDPDYDFEIAKLAVSPKAQGKGVGWQLGQAIIAKAIELGASKIYLEGNTLLKASIHLYRKLGFRKISGHSSPYKRVNIQMELDLSSWGL